MVKLFGSSILLLAVLVPYARVSAQGADFSAEMVETTKGDAKPRITRIYVHGPRMKLVEATPEEGAAGSYMLLDTAAKTAYAVTPSERMYLDMSAMFTADPKGRAWRFFRPQNPKNACPEWLQITKEVNDNMTCKRVADDSLNGRSVVKYEGSSDNGQGAIWVDARLDFLVKMQDENSVTIVQKIKEGPQPASEFELPAGYHKMERPTPPQN